MKKNSPVIFFIKHICIYLSIFIVSFVLCLSFSLFNKEAFILDDNRTQWLPIIEKAYSSFLYSFHMPIYDFFQFKGFSIANEGYYSVMNPFMLISYLFYYFLKLPIRCITIYICLLFSLGNLAFFALARRFKLNYLWSILLTLSYSGIGCFFAYNYWYYVFNTFLFVPLLILVFICTKDKKLLYISSGVILGLEMYLGNAQYTFYHYFIFLFLCLAMALNEKKYLLALISNVITSVILSFPIILLLMNASKGFVNSDFSTFSIGKMDLIIGGLIPEGILGEFGLYFYKNMFKETMGRNDYCWLYNGAYVFLLLITLYCLIRKFIYKIRIIDNSDLNKKDKLYSIKLIKSKTSFIIKSQNNLLLLALLFSIAFFFSLCTGGLVAYYLEFMPVIKNFRFLFKGIFVLNSIIPCFIVVSFKHYSYKMKNNIIIPVAFLCLIGIINNYFVYNLVKDMFCEYQSYSIEQENIIYDREYRGYFKELDKYRVATFNKGVGISPDKFRYYKSLGRNYSTVIENFSLVGYETSISDNHFQNQFDTFYKSDDWFPNFEAATVFGTFALFDVNKNFEKDRQKVENHFINNCVKYILVERDEGNDKFLFNNREWFDKENIVAKTDDHIVDDFIDELNKCENISISEIIKYDENYDLIVLDGVNSICEDVKSEAIELRPVSMDILSFKANGSELYNLSFVYDENFKAFGYDQYNNKIDFNIIKNSFGDITISNCSEFDGIIYLQYKDYICVLGFIFEIIASFAFICLLFALITGGKHY